MLYPLRHARGWLLYCRRPGSPTLEVLPRVWPLAPGRLRPLAIGDLARPLGGDPVPWAGDRGGRQGRRRQGGVAAAHSLDGGGCWLPRPILRLPLARRGR